MLKIGRLQVACKPCLILVWLLMLASPIAVLSQTPSPPARERIEELDFLIGEWKGKGWFYRLDGSRGAEITQSTKVKRGKDNSTLRITGKRRYPDMRLAPDNPVSGSVLSYPMSSSIDATVYYDEGTALYHWRPATPQGRKTPFQARLIRPGTLQVKFEYPGGILLRTIEVTQDAEWRERYEIWLGEKDGWFKSQEIVLKKVK